MVISLLRRQNVIWLPKLKIWQKELWYALYPVCYVIAIVGTIMVSEFSVIACRFPKITMPFKYLGKNSLYMFCIHMLDSYLIQWVWKRTNNEYINSLCRVIVDCVIFAVTMLVLESLKKYRRNQKWGTRDRPFSLHYKGVFDDWT